jgi:hypothetical protein
MTVSATLVTKSDEVRRLVRDFAHGLGCRIQAKRVSGPSVRVDMDDDGHSLLEVLTHVALAATQAGVDVAEPVAM